MAGQVHHGPGTDEPIGGVRNEPYNSYRRDALGSVTRLTDANRNTMNTYRYDGWGRATSESETVSNPFRFTGRERNSGTSLYYYYRARTYDLDTGRFTGKDPAGTVDGTHLYVYVGNNPVNRTDPDGRQFGTVCVDVEAGWIWCDNFIAWGSGWTWVGGGPIAAHWFLYL